MARTQGASNSEATPRRVQGPRKGGPPALRRARCPQDSDKQINRRGMTMTVRTNTVAIMMSTRGQINQ